MTNEAEQLALVRSGARATARRAHKRAPEPAAAEQPIAHVVVDVPLTHLDRPFDYAVPQSMSDAAQPGVRVRVRFAGQLVDGFVLDRSAESAHVGSLARLERVVSPEPVLTPEIARLAREVADRYAGNLTDVLRLAIPPRHAATERRLSGEPALPPERPQPGPWTSYGAGTGFLAAVERGEAARAVWTALPTEDWPRALATAAAAALAADRGALVVLPDSRDVDRVVAALTALIGPGHAVVLTADVGPAERYARWLAVRRGTVRAVIGTRAAMFAPVHGLGLAAIWDDGDDLHSEPRAPYPHVREVLALRSHLEGSAYLIGGHACTAEALMMLESGWARAVRPLRSEVRRLAPVVRVAGEDAELDRDPAARSARLPSLALRTAKDALERGPVLVQVPRRGYVPALACGSCRAPARCLACSGPLAFDQAQNAACGWCGRPTTAWQCPDCQGRGLRANLIGARRTAEELGRAFPRVPIRTSGRDGVLPSVSSKPALVVATPGAEPVAEGGYAAALLLDGWALLSRADLRASEEALRRWLAAAALVRPGSAGGSVVVLADGAAPTVQALVRWDPIGHAERELAERKSLGLPPAVRMASLTGAATAVNELIAIAVLPNTADVLGPVAVREPQRGAQQGEADEEARVRALVRAPRSEGARLAAALKAAAAIRSARKAPNPVRIQLDPLEIV